MKHGSLFTGVGGFKRVFKYFIEDADTGEWYHFPIELIPMVHTYGKGWDKPEPDNSDYWTKDPHMAFDYFENKEAAEKFLQEMIDIKSCSFYKGDKGFELRNLIVTEHEFVSPCCKKETECCSNCSTPSPTVKEANVLEPVFRWVKASERLPEFVSREKSYAIRYEKSPDVLATWNWDWINKNTQAIEWLEQIK